MFLLLEMLGSAVAISSSTTRMETASLLIASETLSAGRQEEKSFNCVHASNTFICFFCRAKMSQLLRLHKSWARLRTASR